jgi:hypothetical protein
MTTSCQASTRFIEGATALRNAEELAQCYRTGFIEAARREQAMPISGTADDDSASDRFADCKYDLLPNVAPTTASSVAPLKVSIPDVLQTMRRTWGSKIKSTRHKVQDRAAHPLALSSFGLNARLVRMKLGQETHAFQRQSCRT